MRWLSTAFFLLATTAYCGEVPVIPLEIVEGGKGYKSIGLGSSVVLDTGAEAKGLLLLTAAHVVVSGMDCTNADNVYTYYPPPVSFEAYVDGQWMPAKLKCCSLHGDLALVTVLTDSKYPGLKLADKPPQAGDRLSLNGYVYGLNFNRYWGDVVVVDFGRNFSLLHLDRHPPVGGQSGGPILNNSGELVGTLSGYLPSTPWCGLYTNAEEIRRFVAAGWDGKWESGPIPLAKDQPDRLKPRIPDGEYTAIDPKAPSLH